MVYQNLKLNLINREDLNLQGGHLPQEVSHQEDPHHLQNNLHNKLEDLLSLDLITQLQEILQTTDHITHQGTRLKIDHPHLKLADPKQDLHLK